MLLDNSSKIPSTIYIKTAGKDISSVLLGSCDIAKIIRDLDPDQAHGHDKYSYVNNLC